MSTLNLEKITFEKNEVFKLHEEWKISPSQVWEQASKMKVLYIHSPKILGPSL